MTEQTISSPEDNGQLHRDPTEPKIGSRDEKLSKKQSMSIEASISSQVSVKTFDQQGFQSNPKLRPDKKSSMGEMRDLDPNGESLIWEISGKSNLDGANHLETIDETNDKTPVENFETQFESFDTNPVGQQKNTRFLSHINRINAFCAKSSFESAGKENWSFSREKGSSVFQNPHDLSYKFKDQHPNHVSLNKSQIGGRRADPHLQFASEKLNLSGEINPQLMKYFEKLLPTLLLNNPKFSELMQKNKEAELDLLEKVNENQLLRDKNQSLAMKLNKCKNMIETLQSQKHDKEKELNEFRKFLKDQSNLKEQVEIELIDKKTKLTKWKHEVDDQNERLAELARLLERKELYCQRLEVAGDNHQKEIHSLKELMDNLKLEKNRLKQKIEALQEEHFEKDHEISRVRMRAEQLEKISGVIEMKDNDIERAEGKLQKEKEMNLKAQREITELNQEIEDLKRLLDNETKSREKVENENNNLLSDLTGLEKEKQRLFDENQDLEDRLHYISKEVQQKESEIRGLNYELKQREDEIESKQSELRIKSREVIDLKQNLKDKDHEINHKNHLLDRKDAEIERLRKQLKDRSSYNNHSDYMGASHRGKRSVGSTGNRLARSRDIPESPSYNSKSMVPSCYGAAGKRSQSTDRNIITNQPYDYQQPKREDYSYGAKNHQAKPDHQLRRSRDNYSQAPEKGNLHTVSKSFSSSERRVGSNILTWGNPYEEINHPKVPSNLPKAKTGRRDSEKSMGSSRYMRKREDFQTSRHNIFGIGDHQRGEKKSSRTHRAIGGQAAIMKELNQSKPNIDFSPEHKAQKLGYSYFEEDYDRSFRGRPPIEQKIANSKLRAEERKKSSLAAMSKSQVYGDDQVDKENIKKKVNMMNVSTNSRQRSQNRINSLRLIKDPENPIRNNIQKSPSKGYPNKYNYIPRKAPAVKPTMERKAEEMSEMQRQKKDLEGRLLQFQLQRDNVTSIFPIFSTNFLIFSLKFFFTFFALFSFLR